MADFRALNRSTFDRLSAIMSFHALHIKLFLARLNFSNEAYRTRSLHLTFRHLTFPLLWTINDWAVILATGAVGLHLLPEYASIYGAVLQMKHYDRFASHSIVSFTLIEWLFKETLSETLNYANGMLQVVLELETTIDRMFNKRETAGLLRLFTRRLAISTVTLRAMILGTIATLGQLLVGFCQAYAQGRIGLFAVFAYFWLALAANLFGLYMLVFPCYFNLHLFFVVRLFKMRLRGGLQGLKCGLSINGSGTQVGSTLLGHFQAVFLSLHRQIVLYNGSSRRHFLMYDRIFKFAGSLSMAMFLTSHTTAMTQGSYLIVVMFAGSYGLMQAVLSLLTVFPAQADQAYRIMLKMDAKSARREGGGGKGRWRPVEEIHYRLRLNRLIEFTGGNHRFGFTAGNSPTILIRTMNIIENVGSNLYFLVLFYKRII